MLLDIKVFENGIQTLFFHNSLYDTNEKDIRFHRIHMHACLSILMKNMDNSFYLGENQSSICFHCEHHQEQDCCCAFTDEMFKGQMWVI